MYKIQFIALGLLCFFSSSFGQDYFREGLMNVLLLETQEVEYRKNNRFFKVLQSVKLLKFVHHAFTFWIGLLFGNYKTDYPN